jgi:hypothetical protein
MSVKNNVESHAWGRIIVDGVKFKDVILTSNKIGGSAIEWDWAWCEDCSPMRHVPGYRIADMDKFVLSNKKCDSVILSTGREEKLNVNDEIVEYLYGNGIAGRAQHPLIERVYVLPTDRAINQYNRMNARGDKVIAFIHSTC